ncbi:MAG: peptidoglycan-binding protein [Gammaproteobacteria bacterium]|nr:peptidoglycan-binding protein [Gammaproteobacteria bacterium]
MTSFLKPSSNNYLVSSNNRLVLPESTTGSNFGRSARLCLFSLISILLNACTPIDKDSSTGPEPIALPEQPIHSAEPIKGADRNKILFAQTALKKLGYKIGRIDGIWGPRSASAIREFEQNNGLVSADGFLSELNLNHLAKKSELDPSISIAKPKVPAGLSAKVKGNLKRTGPQLVIVENSYKVFVDANPYSKMLFELQPGTGIYVIAKIEDWYQIESINRKQGFVQAD